MAAPAVNAQGAIDAYLQSALADSEAFGKLSDLLLDESDADMASTLSSIEGAGGTDNPAIYWALQMALADRFGTPKPVIADATVAQQAQQVYSDYGAGLRDYVDAVHTATQQYFGDYGVSEVTAYHGLNYPQAPNDLHFDMAARNANMALSGITVYSQDPAAVITAALASQQGLTPNLAHVIAAQQVPISDIWSVNGDGSLRVLPSASDTPSLYVGWEADSPGDTWTPDPSTVSGLLEPFPDALGGEYTPPPPPSNSEQPATSESPPGDIYQQTWDYRQQLLDGVASAQQSMSDYYAGALEQINAQMMALAKKIWDAQQAGEDVDPMWLAREQSLAQLYIDIEDRMSQAGQQASDALGQAMNDAANLGVATGNAQLNAMIPNIDQLLAKAGVDTLWSQPSEQALQNMVGAGQDANSPLNMAFGALGQAAIDLIKHGLFNGLALGQNPLTVGSQLASDVQDLTLSRANAIARNEMLRAYRTANLMSFQENSDVVDGWVWVAALSTNTCAFCWAENGGFHTSDETLDSHVSCACVMVPVTGDWSSVLSDLEEAGLDESDLEELGINFDEIEDTTVQVPSGEEIFAKQPPDVQEKVLGPGKMALYQNGDLTLQDLVGHYHDEQWGGVGYEKSLKDLGFTPDDIAAAKAAITSREAEPLAPPEPQLTPTQIADQAGERVRAAEEEAQQAIREAAKTPPTTILGKIKAWADIHFKLSQADQAWRAEIDAIDQRMLANRLAQQKLERGAGPLTPQVEEAAKRLLEERYRQAKSERGVNPLTEEVRQIEQRQLEQRTRNRKEGQPPEFAAKSQPREPLVPLSVKRFETYTLTPEDKAFAASIKEQIGPEGVLDHEQAIEIGRQIQERIAQQTSQTAGWAQETADIRTSLPNLSDEQKAWINGDKAAMEAHGGVDFYSAPDAYQADYRAKTVAYLQEIRSDEGGLGGESLRLAAGDEYVASQLNEAAKMLPSDWIKASNDLGEITPSKNRATNSDGWFIQDNSFETGNGEIALSYSKNRDELGVQAVALHELIHRMEVAVPQLSRMEGEFYNRRTAGETPQRLTNGIGLMNTKLDQWLDQYLGAEPLSTFRPEYTRPDGIPARTAVNYELLTNGVQMAMGHVAEVGKFAQDREFERFVLGSLAGVKARPEVIEPVKGRAPGEPEGRPAYKPHEESNPYEKRPGETIEDYSKRMQQPGKLAFNNEWTGILDDQQGAEQKAIYENDTIRKAVHDFAFRNSEIDDREARNSLRSNGSFVHGKDPMSKEVNPLFAKAAERGIRDVFANIKGVIDLHTHMTQPIGFSKGDWEYYIRELPKSAVVSAGLGDGTGRVLIFTLTPPEAHAWPSQAEFEKAYDEASAKYPETKESLAAVYNRNLQININVARATGMRFGWEVISPEGRPARAARNPSPFHQVEEGAGQRSFAAKKPAPEEEHPMAAKARAAQEYQKATKAAETQDEQVGLAIDFMKKTNDLTFTQEDDLITAHSKSAPDRHFTPEQLIQQANAFAKTERAAWKIVQERLGLKPPSVATERVSVAPVKPPRVRTLTVEQQAKRDAADAIKAAKAATTITKRGEALEISQGDMTARVEPDSNLGGYRLTLGDQTTEGATLARVNALLKERLGYPSAVKAGQIEAGPPKTAAEKKAYRESGVKNATTVEKIGEQPLPPGHLIDYADVASFTAQNAPDIPPLLYHVTNERGERALLRTGPNFDADQGRLADQGRGFYMTPLPFEPYMVYGNDRAVTVAAAIKNPWRFEAQDFRDLKTQLQRDYGDGWEDELHKRIRSGGYDALVVYPNFDFQREYGWTFIIAQDPSQVRFVTDAPEVPPAVDREALEKPKVKAALEEHEQQIAALRAAGQATSGGAQGLRFTRPDGQAVTVERDMVNGGYKVTIGGETTEGLTIAKANALLKPFLGYNAPLAKEELPAGVKPKPVKQMAKDETGQTMPFTEAQVAKLINDRVALDGVSGLTRDASGVAKVGGKSYYIKRIRDTRDEPTFTSEDDNVDAKTQAANEIAATRIAQEAGLGDLVLPDAWHVKQDGVDYLVTPLSKAKSLFDPDNLSRTKDIVREALSTPEGLTKHTMLDYLIGRTDPNFGNYLVGPDGDLIHMDFSLDMGRDGITDQADFPDVAHLIFTDVNYDTIYSTYFHDKFRFMSGINHPDPWRAAWQGIRGIQRQVMQRVILDKPTLERMATAGDKMLQTATDSGLNATELADLRKRIETIQYLAGLDNPTFYEFWKKDQQ